MEKYEFEEEKKEGFLCLGHLIDPRKIGSIGIQDRKLEDLRGFVFAMLGKKSFDSGEKLFAAFHRYLRFLLGMELTIPDVDRLHPGNNLSAGNEFFFDKLSTESSSEIDTRAAPLDVNVRCHGFSCSQYSRFLKGFIFVESSSAFLFPLCGRAREHNQPDGEAARLYQL